MNTFLKKLLIAYHAVSNQVTYQKYLIFHELKVKLSFPPISLINPPDFKYAAQSAPAASSHSPVATTPSPVTEPETTQSAIKHNKPKDGEETHNLPKQHSNTSTYYNILNHKRQERTRRRTTWITNSKQKQEKLRKCAQPTASFLRGLWTPFHQSH